MRRRVGCFYVSREFPSWCKGITMKLFENHLWAEIAMSSFRLYPLQYWRIASRTARGRTWQGRFPHRQTTGGTAETPCRSHMIPAGRFTYRFLHGYNTWPFLNGRGQLYVIGIALIGILMSVMVLLKIKKIANDQDRQLKVIKMFEKTNWNLKAWNSGYFPLFHAFLPKK